MCSVRSFVLALTSSIICLTGLPSLSAQSKKWTDLGYSTGPVLEASTPHFGRRVVLRVSNIPPGSGPVAFAIGASNIDIPFVGTTLVPSPDLIVWSGTPFLGFATASVLIPDTCNAEVPVWVQAGVFGPAGLQLSNAITATVQKDVPSDFNGDGMSDLAVGSPGENGGQGAVSIVYGGNALPSVIFQQGGSLNGTISNNAEAGDAFGAALTSGDFDGDGYDDLAIAAPNEGWGATPEVGIVQILYGSDVGLQAGSAGRNDQLFRQGVGGLADTVENYDHFGASLTANDFDGDGCDDLAIGCPDENLTEFDQGAVHVLFGSPIYGLSGSGSAFVTEPVFAIDEGDRFGFELESGDFDGDGFYEIAVGNPFDDMGSDEDVGSVRIIEAPGMNLSDFIHQGANLNGFFVIGVAEPYDKFGSSLAAADFDGDGRDDLAIGVPQEDFEATPVYGAGVVNVIYGSPSGLTGLGDQIWHQDIAGIPDNPGFDDRFGHALAAGDFDNDGFADLAISAPGETLIDPREGVVHVIYGQNAVGLQAAGNQLWHQDTPQVNGTGEAYDRFGSALMALDFDGDCMLDLVIGVPGEDLNGLDDAGAILLMYGSAAGISASGDTIYSQSPLPGVLEAGDRFGASFVGSPDKP